MTDTKDIFHLAIPCKDLAETEHYYGTQLGCEIARVYRDRVTLNFFGMQLVCHLAPDEIDIEPQMYPRHFGITFATEAAFDALYEKASSQGLPFFQDLFTRFPRKQEEHKTFFLKDPANNLLEFKYYYDASMMF